MQAKNAIPYRQLGRTGENVSLVGLGGWHIGNAETEAEGVAIIRRALDEGINFLDNSWDYNEGRSEEWMGKALRDGYRQKAFLMTKVDGRTKKLATAQLHESLRRLQVETIDLLQLHEIIRLEDADWVFAPGGAVEALAEARQQGKVRFVGFTGHKDPAVHLKMLETAKAHDFYFDTVQMPLNVMDAHFLSFEHNVLPLLLKQGTGILAMKAIGCGWIMNSGAVSAVECLHYVMNLPVSVVVTGCETQERLTQALQAARTFRPLSEEDVRSLLARTAIAAKDGEFEPFKTDQIYDDTSKHPEWMGITV